jgi:hypothetical protein
VAEGLGEVIFAFEVVDVVPVESTVWGFEFDTIEVGGCSLWATTLLDLDTDDTLWSEFGGTADVVVLFKLEDSQSCQPRESVRLVELGNDDRGEVVVASTTFVLVLVVEVKLSREVEDPQSCQPRESVRLVELDNDDLEEVVVASTTVVLVLVVEVKLPRVVEDSQSCHPLDEEGRGEVVVATTGVVMVVVDLDAVGHVDVEDNFSVDVV